jgi:hypothetical protein
VCSVRTRVASAPGDRSRAPRSHPHAVAAESVESSWRRVVEPSLGAAKAARGAPGNGAPFSTRARRLVGVGRVVDRLGIRTERILPAVPIRMAPLRAHAHGESRNGATTTGELARATARLRGVSSRIRFSSGRTRRSGMRHGCSASRTGRVARLGATRDSHHALLTRPSTAAQSAGRSEQLARPRSDQLIQKSLSALSAEYQRAPLRDRTSGYRRSGQTTPWLAFVTGPTPLKMNRCTRAPV